VTRIVGAANGPNPRPTDDGRYVIVNADDLGQSDGVNRGVIEAHERGIVTSASLMVHWPSAVDAAAYGRSHPSLSLGLHVDLGEWAYRDDTWVPIYEVVAPTDAAAMATELSRQLDRFRHLVGRDPTHLDSHQHVHRSEPTRSVVIELARALGVPARHHAPEVRYCGEFYGQSGKGVPLEGALTVEALIRLLVSLPHGLTELGCHPGYADDLDSMYRVERRAEVRALCDPRVRAALTRAGIALRSFRDIAPNDRSR
jgi:chitin disaccharide deacetylase